MENGLDQMAQTQDDQPKNEFHLRFEDKLGRNSKCDVKLHQNLEYSSVNI